MEKPPRVKVIARREGDFSRSNRSEAFKLFKNTNPDLHPLSQPTEYVRAVRAAKMKHMNAKPFIGSLVGHSEGVYSLCKHARDLHLVISGGADGEIRIWDVSARKCIRTIKAHPLIVNDVACSPNVDLILSVGSDCNVCGFSSSTSFAYPSEYPLAAVDASFVNDNFITAGRSIDLWSPNRNKPMQKFEFGATDYVDSVFNPSENTVFAACANDDSILIGDTRLSSVVRRILLRTRSNAVDWNPQTPFHFLAANDDSKIYLFDMRKTETALRVYTDHLDPVTCVSFSPNGKEFISGSYDTTVRIWDWEESKSKDCYHTHRMQRVFSCCVSPDAKFALCGSEDMNIRLFKTRADEELGPINRRQKAAQDYQDRLLLKWRHAPGVKKIAEKQNLPKKLHEKRRQRAIMMAAENRKTLARMAHSTNPEDQRPEPLRKGRIVSDQA